METGEIVDANEVFRDLFGYTPEEARQLTLDDVSSGEPPYTQEDALRWIHKAAKERAATSRVAGEGQGR